MSEPVNAQAARARRVKRNTLVLTLFALALYAGFIVMSVSRATH